MRYQIIFLTIKLIIKSFSIRTTHDHQHVNYQLIFLTKLSVLRFLTLSTRFSSQKILILLFLLLFSSSRFLSLSLSLLSFFTLSFFIRPFLSFLSPSLILLLLVPSPLVLKGSPDFYLPSRFLLLSAFSSSFLITFILHHLYSVFAPLPFLLFIIFYVA